MKFFIVSIFLFLSSSVCLAYENLELELDSGTTMNLTHFEGDGKTLLMWLPSERGFGRGYVSVALNLALLDYDVWAVQLHDSYVIPTGRHSLGEVEIDDLMKIIDFAQQQGYEEIYLISSSRGVLLSLNIAHLYQQLHQDSDILKGLLTFSPHLIKGRTAMGEDAEYETMTSMSNLPVYMLQPQYGTKFARSREIADQLQRGGSQVFIQILRETQAGFYMRPDDDLTKRDLAMRDQLPQIIDQAVDLLRHTRTAKLKAIKAPDNVTAGVKKRSLREPILHPFKGDKTAPDLTLKNLHDQISTLDDLKGSVVLVNFWASWCGPCVEEIPSLSRLIERMEGKPFKVVAVNIGESAADIKQFLKSIPVNFEILLDTDGAAVRDWKVYAYPSNYLLDREGKIQFAYRGALKWDADNIVETIELLLP